MSSTRRKRRISFHGNSPSTEWTFSLSLSLVEYSHLRGVSICNFSSFALQEPERRRRMKKKQFFLVNKNTNALCTRIPTMMGPNYLPVFLSIHFVSFHFDKLPVEWFIAYTQTLDRLHSQPQPKFWTVSALIYLHTGQASYTANRGNGSRVSYTIFSHFFFNSLNGSCSIRRVCYVFLVRTLEIHTGKCDWSATESVESNGDREWRNYIRMTWICDAFQIDWIDS